MSIGEEEGELSMIIGSIIIISSFALYIAEGIDFIGNWNPSSHVIIIFLVGLFVFFVITPLIGIYRIHEYNKKSHDKLEYKEGFLNSFNSIKKYF